MRQKRRKRKQQAILNQTQEQLENTNRQKRVHWNTHAHTINNITVGQVYDARRRQRENDQLMKDIKHADHLNTWYKPNVVYKWYKKCVTYGVEFEKLYKNWRQTLYI